MAIGRAWQNYRMRRKVNNRMEKQELCYICGAPAVLRCRMCGRPVCEKHQVNGVCIICLRGRFIDEKLSGKSIR